MGDCTQATQLTSTSIPPIRGRILVIDDFEVVREIVRTVLEKAGFHICGEAADGVDGIEQAKRLKPDLIVMDLVMPRMNGVEATSVLKGVMASVPIVALTMYEQNMGATLAHAVGVRAIISKADGLDKLVACVECLLSAPQQSQQSPA